MGDLLIRNVPLSRLDVEEVLAEQSIDDTKPFGQVALSLGLCTPEHVWKAWVEQLSDGPREIDLDQVGIDAQSLYSLPARLAIEFAVVPVRLVNGILVLAASSESLPKARRELPGIVTHEIRFALADADDIARAIELCYLPLQAQC